MAVKRCKLCKKTRSKVRVMLAIQPVEGKHEVYLCEKCIKASYKEVKKHLPKEVKTKNTKKQAQPKTQVPTPRQLKEYLDRFVIGQNDAKKEISIAVYNHYKRINNKAENCIQKSNVLVIGPSGTGKTYIASNIAKALDIPFVIVDATTLTEAGYVGNDVTKIVEQLLHEANYDVEKAQNGIVFIDEIDKKRKRTVDSSKDVSGEGVQQALLKMVEGTTVTVSDAEGKSYDVNTSDILFIAGGAFVGLSDIVKKNMRGKSTMGFNASVKTITESKLLYKDATSEDLIEYGLIPEFVGRFPVLVTLDPLTESSLAQILTVPENSIITQYKHLFKLDGVDIEFSDKYIKQVAKTSFQQKTGARGLRNIIESHLSDIQFELPELTGLGIKSVYVDENGVVKKKPDSNTKNKDQKKAQSQQTKRGTK